LRAEVSADLLAAATGQHVRDARPVTDVILGTRIRGSATTDAHLVTTTVPSSGEGGHIELLLRGVVRSDTVGRNGPVVIYSSGQTPFTSRKSIYFDAEGLRELPACTDAETRTDIHCIQSVRGGIGSGLVQKIAWKRAGQQKSQAEAIASRRAATRISDGFNTRTGSLIAEAQDNFLRNFRLPLVRRDEFPEYFNVRTTGSGLTVTLVQATPYQLGATSAPPPPQGEYDLTAAIHESLPNNLAAAWLSGYRLTEEGLRQRIIKMGREVPPELEEGDEPWSITFADQRPVSVSFDDGGLTVTVRGQEFTSGDDAYGAMDITARYEFVTTDRGVIMRRQGDLEILPPGFRPGEDVLSPEQAALVELLIKHLGNVFKPEVQGDGIELPGELSRAGKLLPVEATSRDEWLVLGWNRSDAPTLVADTRERSPGKDHAR
jgi:hypothetical protein